MGARPRQQLMYLLAANEGSVNALMALIIVALLVVMVFLSLAETGLTRMTPSRAAGLAESGRSRAKLVVRLVNAPEQFLNPLLFALFLVQSAETAVAAELGHRLFGLAGAVVAVAINVLVFFVLAVAAPKTWAVQHPDQAALLAARPVRALTRFPPLRLLSRALIGLTNVLIPGKGLKQGPFVSEEELLAFADQAAAADVIEVEERALINRIIEFGDTVVREVMVPRTDMISVEATFRVADVMEVVLLNGRSRVPVIGEGIDDVVGVAYAKDLMRAERDGNEDQPVGSLARAARFVPETKRVADLLREMQAEQFHMAIVIDEYGGTAGLVTLEDLIEELVGEIVDEYDVEHARVQPLPGGDVRVEGRLSIDDANDVLDRPLPEGDWDTVGGLVFSTLGRVPEVGDVVEIPGFRLRVVKMQGRRIAQVRISLLELPPEHDDDEDEGDDKGRDRDREVESR